MICMDQTVKKVFSLLFQDKEDNKYGAHAEMKIHLVLKSRVIKLFVYLQPAIFYIYYKQMHGEVQYFAKL